MASAAEQLAANLNFGALAKSEDLKSRIWFTLGALIVYRLGTYIPIPGIDTIELAKFAAQNSSGILGWVNGLAGGALGRMAIFALNIMPYISASIIIQLMTTVSPHLEALKKEGESGRKKMNQYTRYGTVVLAALQAYGIAVGLEGQGNLVSDPGMFFRASTVITLTGGTVFLMWLGEQITARGIGNGISLIIFAGIVAGLPGGIAAMLELGRTGQLSTFVILGIMIMALGVVAFIVSVRAGPAAPADPISEAPGWPESFPGRQFASAAEAEYGWRYSADLCLVAFAAADYGGEFQRRAGPGLADFRNFAARPRQAAVSCPLCDADYFLRLLLHVHHVQSEGDGGESEEVWRLRSRHPPGRAHGRIYRLCADAHHGYRRPYLTLVCLLPEFLIGYTGVPFYFGGTSLLIVVSVTMDTVAQLQGHLYAQQYEGLIKKSKLRGNRK